MLDSSPGVARKLLTTWPPACATPTSRPSPTDVVVELAEIAGLTEVVGPTDVVGSIEVAFAGASEVWVTGASHGTGSSNGPLWRSRLPQT